MWPEEKPPPQINVRFHYAYCNDIGAIRRFYTEGLGMLEASCIDNGEMGWIVYQSEGFQLMFFRDEEAVVEERWAYLPGDGSGDAPIAGFSVHVPEAGFARVIERLQDQEVPAQTDGPTWRQDSYWGWSVKDPMGQTIEVYTSPAATPHGDPPLWPE